MRFLFIFVLLFLVFPLLFADIRNRRNNPRYPRFKQKSTKREKTEYVHSEEELENRLPKRNKYKHNKRIKTEGVGVDNGSLVKQKRFQQHVDNAKILRDRLKRDTKRAKFDEVEEQELLDSIEEYYQNVVEKAKSKLTNEHEVNSGDMQHALMSGTELRDIKQSIEQRIKNQIDRNSEF